ncbi:MAG: hypothetical protein M1821_003456 [Bathelium mastoideum]|nr:MAG: hypothetical protein M1821_003456 [Bathelium mastoideum]
MPPVTRLATKRAAQTEKPKCGFLGLPTELRLQIYELALDTDVVFTLGTVRIPNNEIGKRSVGIGDRVPLLGVSKQVRQEAYGIFFKFTDFYVRVEVKGHIDPDTLPAALIEGFTYQLKLFPVEDVLSLKIVISRYPWLTKKGSSDMTLGWSSKNGRGKAVVSQYFNCGCASDAFEAALEGTPRNNLIIKSFTYPHPQDVGRYMPKCSNRQTEPCTIRELINATGEYGRITWNYECANGYR